MKMFREKLQLHGKQDVEFMFRVVLDTNVLVSAVVSDGKSRELLKKGIAGQYHLILSDLILKELIAVLRRPKFKTSEDEVHRIILALLRTADVVSVKTRVKVVKEDPKDDMVVETAVDGEAGMIVTGDEHLLVMKSFRRIRIVSVDQMLTYLR